MAAEYADENWMLECQFIEEDGEEGELMTFELSSYMQMINKRLTAFRLIEFLFTKVFNFDERQMKVR